MFQNVAYWPTVYRTGDQPTMINYNYPSTMLNWRTECQMSFDSPTIYFLSISNLSSFYGKIPFSHKFSTFFWSSLGNFPFKCQINLPIHCVSKLWSVLRILELRLDHMRHPYPRFLAQSWGSGISKLLCQYSIEPRVPFIFKYSGPKITHHSNLSSSLYLTNCKLI